MQEDINIILGKYFAGEATPDERQQVESWVRESEENRAGFDLLGQVWSSLDEVKEVSFDTDAAWNKVQKRIHEKRQNSIVRKMGRLAIGIAAALMLAAGAWWMMSAEADMHRLTAGADNFSLLLHDGSRVYLRKGSTLEYPEKFTGATRGVTLRGEAFFEIKKDSRHPFVIRAGEDEITVLGTSFIVRNTESITEVIVHTGRVRFSSGGHSAELGAGERARSSDGRMIQMKNLDPNFNSWHTGVLRFEQATLAEIAEAVSSLYKINFELDPAIPEISTIRVTSTFEKQELASVLEELELVTGFDIILKGSSHYFMTKNKQ